jgi:hypothetical protein
LLDLEQIARGHSDEFWQLIRERGGQKAMGRAEVKKRMADE